MRVPVMILGACGAVLRVRQGRFRAACPCSTGVRLGGVQLRSGLAGGGLLLGPRLTRGPGRRPGCIRGKEGLCARVPAVARAAAALPRQPWGYGRLPARRGAVGCLPTLRLAAGARPGAAGRPATHSTAVAAHSWCRRSSSSSRCRCRGAVAAPAVGLPGGVALPHEGGDGGGRPAAGGCSRQHVVAVCEDGHRVRGAHCRAGRVWLQRSSRGGGPMQRAHMHSRGWPTSKNARPSAGSSLARPTGGGGGGPLPALHLSGCTAMEQRR